MWDFLVFHPHTLHSWTKHLSHCGKFPPRPRNIPRRMSLSPFACGDDETITSHAQPNACRYSRLDLPALVSVSWHLSPIAPNYDRCYRNALTVMNNSSTTMQQVRPLLPVRLFNGFG